MTTHTPSDYHLLPTHRASPPHNTSITPPATTANLELLLHTTAIYSSPNQYTVGPYYRYNWWAVTVSYLPQICCPELSNSLWTADTGLLLYWAILSSLRVHWYINSIISLICVYLYVYLLFAKSVQWIAGIFSYVYAYRTSYIYWYI